MTSGTVNSAASEAKTGDGAPAPWDVTRVRADFPILARRIQGRPLVYLDNAATTQKPVAVLDAMRRYYEHENANVHRGVHRLSQEATDAYEGAREKVRLCMGADSSAQIIFVRGATEAINLVAASYGGMALRAGDEVLVTQMEHHSNIVPWQIACRRAGATLRVAPVTESGEIDLEAFESLVGPRTRIVAVVHVSNMLGTINPVHRVVEIAHARGAVTLVDGAQAMGHLDVDVKAIDSDFYAWSAHKAYGPTGIGVLYGRRDLLEEMDPYQSGGDMIKDVSFERTIYNDLPHKFEAGTPNMAGAVGLGAALDYLADACGPAARHHEQQLLEHATAQLASIDGVRLIGTAPSKVPILSFVLDGVHPHDAGTVLDGAGIAVRTGHHCTQPLMERFNVPATIRASLSFYNTREEVDFLAEGVPTGCLIGGSRFCVSTSNLDSPPLAALSAAENGDSFFTLKKNRPK